MTDQEQGFEAHFHFLTPGCLGPYIDKFAAELASAGYTTLSIDNYQQSIAHFGTWLQYKSAGIGDCDAVEQIEQQAVNGDAKDHHILDSLYNEGLCTVLSKEKAVE